MGRGFISSGLSLAYTLGCRSKLKVIFPAYKKESLATSGILARGNPYARDRLVCASVGLGPAMLEFPALHKVVIDITAARFSPPANRALQFVNKAPSFDLFDALFKIPGKSV